MYPGDSARADGRSQLFLEASRWSRPSHPPPTGSGAGAGGGAGLRLFEPQSKLPCYFVFVGTTISLPTCFLRLVLGFVSSWLPLGVRAC